MSLVRVLVFVFPLHLLVETILEVYLFHTCIVVVVSQQSGIRSEVQFVLKFQSKVCFGLSAFVCVKDGSEYQQNDIFEW